MSRPDWALIVHGGAKTIPEEEREAHRAGCLAALKAGQAVLRRGGAAVEAVVAAIRVLEDDPTFNAGAGAVTRTDGRTERDAALMDGATLDIGAVAALQGVRHPILVAHALLDTRQVLLAGEGAWRFANRRGLTQREHVPHASVSTSAFRPATKSASCDTVGCVALDRYGNLAAGTSTGGTENQPPGRVGDSPLPGSGFYADDTQGAAAVSGDGECIARVLLARQALEGCRTRPAQQAVAGALSEMVTRVGGEAGVILLTAEGVPVWEHNSDQFAVAWQTAEMNSPEVALERRSAATEQPRRAADGPA